MNENRMYLLLIAGGDYGIRRKLAACCPWEQLGFEIAGQTGDGLAAYEFIKTRPVDVLLCGARLPVLSGPELAMELHEQKIPVTSVVLDEPSDGERARRGNRSGTVRFLRSSDPAEITRIFAQLKAELDAGGRPAGWNVIPGRSRAAGVIDRIQTYLRHNFATATLRSAARLVYMEPANLSRFYRRQTGGSFSGYMKTVKMQAAAGLLRNSDRKIREISTMTGYASPKNFARVFKKHWGMSPRAYRLGGYAGRK